MSTRIEIELTSVVEGRWTWRAAGAREPRGTVDASLLPSNAAIGDQLRVETEKDLDGIRIVSIVAAKGPSERANRLELLPSTEAFEPVVEVRATRDRHEGGRGRPRRDDRGDRGDRRGDRDRRGGDRDRRPDPGGRSEPDRRGERAPTGEQRSGPRRDGDAGDDRRRQRPHFTPPPEIPQRPKPKRLRPGKQHLEAVLTALPEEQRPVAELALQGLPAVRQRIREDNARLAAEDRPTMPEATVLKMAEELLPRLRVAEWLDRADAAKRQLAHLDLRDLRSVVVASDDPVVVRDEATRDLAGELKAALLTKQDEELTLWLADVESAAEVGRVVRALKLSALPPKAGVPFPAPLGTKLGELTNAALTPDDPADRWIAVLEAAAFSPVRTHVQPTGVPAEVSDDLRATVVRLAPLLPQVAALFAIEVPTKVPMPKPLRVQPRKKEAATRPRANVASHPGPAGRTDRPKPAAAASKAGAARKKPAMPAETPAAEPEDVSTADAADATDATDATVAADVATADVAAPSAPSAETADQAEPAAVADAENAVQAEPAAVADAEPTRSEPTRSEPTQSEPTTEPAADVTAEPAAPSEPAAAADVVAESAAPPAPAADAVADPSAQPEPTPDAVAAPSAQPEPTPDAVAEPATPPEPAADAPAEPAAQTEPTAAAVAKHGADDTTDEVAPEADRGASNANARAGLAADDAELPTFAE